VPCSRLPEIETSVTQAPFELPQLGSRNKKNMAIVFDRDFGRVWSDGTTPCVFSSLVRVPTKEEIDELADKQLQLIRELKHGFGSVYSILDLHLCPLVPYPIILHYVATTMPRQFKAGIKHKAFVAPEESKSYKVIVKSFMAIADQPISLHASFENALSKINEVRVKYSKPKSFFFAKYF
jgi:hypothetical protein